MCCFFSWRHSASVARGECLWFLARGDYLKTRVIGEHQKFVLVSCLRHHLAKPEQLMAILLTVHFVVWGKKRTRKTPKLFPSGFQQHVPLRALPTILFLMFRKSPLRQWKNFFFSGSIVLDKKNSETLSPSITVVAVDEPNSIISRLTISRLEKACPTKG